MKCVICSRDLEDHSAFSAVRCLRSGFGIKMNEARAEVERQKLVQVQSQPSQNKNYWVMQLKDGSQISTFDIEKSFVKILLGWGSPSVKAEEPEPEAPAET